jgi:thymidylate kinase
MTASSRCSDTTTPHAVPATARLIVLEGMPGAGKTTAAAALAGQGHSVVGEYTDDSDATIAIAAHPGITDDDAHLANWLRKAAQCADRLTSRPVVYADRDWLSSLSYAYSADDGNLLDRRAAWAARHLSAGILLLPSAYAVFDLDPAASIARRATRLRAGHPWNHPAALERLRRFYLDPAACLRPVSPELAATLSVPAWTAVSGHDEPAVTLARIESLARPA